MRAYFFGNMYLSSIQQGIQAAHVVSELFVKYSTENSVTTAHLREWAENHKTVILLNGGYSEHIRELIHFFHSAENQYPWTVFNESLDALDGAVTCAGIVLPEKIYEGAALLRSDRDGFILNTLKATDTITLENGVEGYNGWEQELMQRLNTFRLAN